MARTPIDLASDLVKRMHWLGNQGNHEDPKMPDCSGPEAKWLTGANSLGLRFLSGCHDRLGLLALSCHSLSPSFLIGLLLNF